MYCLTYWPNSNHYVFRVWFGFWARVLLCSPGWLWTWELLASPSWALDYRCSPWPEWFLACLSVSILPPCSWGCRSMPYVLAPCLSRICLQCSHAFRLSSAGKLLGLSNKRTESSFVLIRFRERKCLMLLGYVVYRNKRNLNKVIL